LLDRIAQSFVVFCERYCPDPFVFAISLTALTFALAVVATRTTTAEALEL
jgi:short subunit fatty acids transporter